MVNHRVTIILRLFERTWLADEVPPMDKIQGVEMVRPEDVRNLGRFLMDRLERVASIMELLLSRGWSCCGTKQAIILEGNDMEAYEVKQFLLDNGFNLCEFEIRLDYTRKWGIM